MKTNRNCASKSYGMNDYAVLVAELRCNRLGCECQYEANGHGVVLHCPAHDDRTPRLSFTVKDGKPLWKCHKGCEQDAVKVAFVAKGIWHEHVANTTAPGLTLAQYTVAKKLPLDFLKSLGLADQKYRAAPAIRIPYLVANAKVATVRYRVGMAADGQRYYWKSGTHQINNQIAKVDSL